MQVEPISAHTTVSLQFDNDLKQDVLKIVSKDRVYIASSLDEVNRTVDERLGKIEEMMKNQETRFYQGQENRLGPYYGSATQHGRQLSRARKGSGSYRHLRSRADAVGIRLARYSITCRPRCSCVCHKEKRSATPAFLDRLFGQLFVGYSGVPGLSPKCNESTCEVSQTTRINLEYWFPLGLFWSQIVRLQAGYQPNIGPQFQMAVMRRIPDSSQAVELALNGNINGLKYLFKTGQASTSDVSSTRGYTLLGWALYGNQWQTCKFLMQAGSDPDYHPANPIEYTPRNKALDFILQGHLSKEDEEALRPIAMESNWMDDQNYTLLHRSVLGLSGIRIEDVLVQSQEDLEAVDTMGRSPLFWAASGGDDREVAMLLGSGADPNNMDYQLDTPLAFAADNGHTKCVRLLLEAGADTEPKRPKGVKFSNPLNRASRSTTDPPHSQDFAGFWFQH